MQDTKSDRKLAEFPETLLSGMSGMSGTDHTAQSVMTIKAPAVLAHNMLLKGTFQNSDQQYLFYQNVLPLHYGNIFRSARASWNTFVS